ncbi:MAG: 23S rRNA (adenine(2503)-C(2))-methyltransferase RlmN, partial [bacterium]|nr:23S rRNA (adenine(2503)-C(2))-methyltransferase RlmN [bacterium]
MKKFDLKEISLRELEDCFVENGFKKFHAGKVYKSLYNKGEERSFRFFPKSLDRFMEDRFYCSSLVVTERRVSQEGTEKFLFQLEDGHSVETVFIPEGHRGTICVSSQVGCKYGCSFCVSGRCGFVRNLSAAEMVNQVVQVMDAVNPGSVSNIVFMGTGEPLDNYDNLIRAIGILREEQGLY